MRRILECIIFFTVMTTSQIFAGNVYYINATNGNNSNNGLSEANAWQNIAKVNGSIFNAGDKILFKRGEIWKEQLIIPFSGSFGNPITFGTYGSGNYPKISGADIESNWTEESGLYYCSSYLFDPHVVIKDGTLLKKESSKGNLNTNDEWWYDSTNKRVYLYGNPSGNKIEIGKRNFCINTNGENYLIIDGLELEGAVEANMYMAANSINVTVKNSKIQNGWYGVKAASGTTNGKIINNTVTNFHYTALEINVGGATGWEISANTISYSGHSGTTQSNGQGVYFDGTGIIEENHVHHCGLAGVVGYEHGIYIGHNGDGTIVRHNKIHDNQYGGIQTYGDDVDIYYNLIYRNEIGVLIPNTPNKVSGIKINNNAIFEQDNKGRDNHAGFGVSIAPNSSVAEMKNNIIYNNKYYSAYEYQVYLKGTLISSDNNLIYATGGGNLCHIDANAKTFVEWQAAGFDANGVSSDPIFMDASDNDFRLQLNSPCIDVGINVGLTQDYAGNTVPVGWGVDIGAYEYQDETTNNPVASFFAYPTEGIPPLEVSFDASASYDPDGNITSFEWDFGDGNTGSGVTLTYTYQNRGIYTAKLTVTDNEDHSASESHEIRVGTHPVAIFEAFPSSGNSPLKVELDASYSYDTDGEVVSYNWDFGDGKQGNGKNSTHTYYIYGEYTATLKITDDDGLFDTTSKEISVAEMPSPPLNVKVTRVTNRGNSIPHCYCRVKWSKNPKNAGKHNIVKYRIYRKIRTAGDNTFVLINEVGYHTFGYDDRSLEDIKELNLYTYAVSAVDDKNRESELGKPTFP